MNCDDDMMMTLMKSRLLGISRFRNDPASIIKTSFLMACLRIIGTSNVNNASGSLGHARAASTRHMYTITFDVYDKAILIWYKVLCCQVICLCMMNKAPGIFGALGTIFVFPSLCGDDIKASES